MEENEKIKEEIFKKYPHLFKADPMQPISMFGIECGPGWYKIIEKACKELCELILDEHKMQFYGFHFTQIKEKFGGLRMYTSYSSDEIDEIIERACKEASITCEETGQPGKLREINGWYHTVSDEVFEQLLKKFE